MNILYLSERDPRDTHFGGAQRTHYIWEALKKVGNVYALHFDQQFKTKEIAPGVWTVRKLMRVNSLQWFFYRMERKIMKPLNVLPLWPLPTYLEKNIDELFPNITFDVVVCRYCFDMAEMHLWNFPRVYIDFDDNPLEMYETVKSRNMNPWLKFIGKKVLQFQLKYIGKKIDGGWVSNPMQLTFLHNTNIAPLNNIPQKPSSNYMVSATRKMKLITIGALSYFPNYSGIDKFLSVIWPQVMMEFPALKFEIIGKGAPMAMVERWKRTPNVVVRGFVDNIEKEYEECLAAVVPIEAGGGTCIKTLEAMAYSRICMATKFGARGLEKTVGGLLLYETASDFIQLLRDVVFHSERRGQAEQSAKAYIDFNYTREAFLNSIFKLVANEHSVKY